MDRKFKLWQDGRQKCSQLRRYQNWTVGEVIHCNSRQTQEICVKFLSVIDIAYQDSCQASGGTNRNKHARARHCSLIQLGRRCTVRGICIIICQQVYTSVSQLPGHGPVPGPGINYTGPQVCHFSFLRIFS
jgi:hypothetical protein